MKKPETETGVVGKENTPREAEPSSTTPRASKVDAMKEDDIKKVRGSPALRAREHELNRVKAELAAMTKLALSNDTSKDNAQAVAIRESVAKKLAEEMTAAAFETVYKLCKSQRKQNEEPKINSVDLAARLATSAAHLSCCLALSSDAYQL